ncbi:uncharacterized protein DC041_0001422 [Schistosoma bovis]|uniref:PWI domain-containing protein n=1 Tax=Schistosoma bovis TaxID=6184 RepID=A0A430QHC4_SCHBO|nr:uncharacterized protein DC041_0001422 [Schistosoma bovis]
MAPMAIPPPPLVTVPTVIPPPNVAAPVVPAVAETPIYVREKPPVTTVFVGNIAECAPDQLIKALLMVKVDPKTEDLLNEYRKKKEKVGEEGTLGATSDEIDQSTQRDDETVKTSLENIIKENKAMLEDEGLISFTRFHFLGAAKKQDLHMEGPRHLTIEDMDLDNDRKDLINREIESFRKRNEDIDNEEESIKKKLEKKLREKEESYQKRLKQWEIRERKKANEYEHERDHERKRQRELQIEAQRLKEFFEDYDDNVEDPKYYRGSALHQRLKDREIEEAADERDRQKEIEQLETARRKLIEEGDPNAESIIFQMEQKMQEHLRRCLLVNGDMSIESSDNQCPEPVSENLPSAEDESKNLECVVKSLETNNLSPACNGVTSEFEPAAPEETSVSLLKDGSNTFLFSMSAVEPVVRKTASAFADEEQDEKPKKHGLSWLPPSALKANSISNPSNGGDSNQNDSNNLPPVSALSTEEKKAIIKRIIEGIPTHKRELFAYPIDWDMVDADFVNSRIKPWVDKKIVSYIGEAEATLSSFICDQLLHHNPPERILADIAMHSDSLHSKVESLSSFYETSGTPVSESNSCLNEGLTMRRGLVGRLFLLLRPIRSQFSYWIINPKPFCPLTNCNKSFRVPGLFILIIFGIPISLSLDYLILPLSLLISVLLLLLALWFCFQYLEQTIVYACDEPPSSKFLYMNPSCFGFSTWELVKLCPNGNTGPTIIGFLLLQPDLCRRKSCPVVLLLHGNAGNSTTRLPMCQVLENRFQCNIFIIDYRGYGQSTGKPSEEGLYADCTCALNYLYMRSDLNNEKIFVLGRSLGGALGIYLAVDPISSEKICGVIIENTFTSITDAASHILNIPCKLPSWLFSNQYTSLARLQSCSKSRKKSSAFPPLLLISGELDNIIPPKMMWKLAEAYENIVTKQHIRNECSSSVMYDDSPNPNSLSQNPVTFINSGRDGLVSFPDGHHNDTWLCNKWSDVILRFIEQSSVHIRSTVNEIDLNVSV